MNVSLPLMKLTARFIRHIPLKLTDRIALCLAQLFHRFSKKGRNTISINLRHIFARGDISSLELRRYLKNTFYNYARTMVDFLHLGSITPDEFSVEMRGLHNVYDALRHGRGCILLTMHIGNWDYAGSYLATRGVPMSALVEETRPEMYEFYKMHRERLGMQTFPLSRAGIAFLHTIKNNRVLAVLGDRDILGNGTTVDFFDGRRNIPRGLGEIVIRRQLPVVFGYMVLHPGHGEHRYLGYIEKPVFFSGTADEFNEVMVNKFEWMIRQFPDQWMLFQSDWVA